MNLDPNLIAAAAFCAMLAVVVTAAVVSYCIGRLPNEEREAMLRKKRDLAAEERDANAKAASEYHAEWVETLRLWNAAEDKAFDEATAANKLRGELEDARAHIMSLSIDIADLIAKNHRDRNPKTGHFIPTHRTRPDVDASLKATADETRPSRVSGGAACAHGA